MPFIFYPPNSNTQSTYTYNRYSFLLVLFHKTKPKITSSGATQLAKICS